MARMEQIEASVGQDYPQTLSFKLVDLEIVLVEGQDLLDLRVAIPLAGRLDGVALSVPLPTRFPRSRNHSHWSNNLTPSCGEKYDTAPPARSAKGNHRNRPAINTVRSRDHCFVAQMLLHERDCLIGGLWQVGPNLDRVQDSQPVLPGEATSLQPRVREEVRPILSEKGKSADGWNLMFVVFGSDSKVAK